jgi:hypothetical protein
MIRGATNVCTRYLSRCSARWEGSWRVLGKGPWISILALLLAGCGHLFEDNGVHLAAVLEDGAVKLRASDAAEIVVPYETLDGGTDPYYIEIVPSSGPGQGGSYLVVSGRSRGGTSAHNSAVFVPQRLYIEKSRGGPTAIVLRRNGDRVEVVELR